jgi:hypothetical protein
MPPTAEIRRLFIPDMRDQIERDGSLQRRAVQRNSQIPLEIHHMNSSFAVASTHRMTFARTFHLE